MRSIHFHKPDKTNISHKNEVFYNYCIFYVKKKLFSNDIIQKQIFIANRADINARALLTWFTILTGKYINHYDLKLIDYDRFLQKVLLFAVRKCTHFANVTNGFVYYQGLEYLNHAVTVCDPGYALSSGDAMRICDANGYWTGNVPVCQGEHCS